jgi:hypothetical protein
MKILRSLFQQGFNEELVSSTNALYSGGSLSIEGSTRPIVFQPESRLLFRDLSRADV